MLAAEGGKPFTDPGWIYEVKYDGYRCMARALLDSGDLLGVGVQSSSTADPR